MNYIRNEENQGRAQVRNIGIAAAKGELIIFLDAEMLTDPTFVENHWLFHQEDENLVITGAMYYKAVYSFVFPEFNRQQMNDLQRLTKRMQRFSRRLNGYNLTDKKNAPYELITKQDVEEQAYKQLVIDREFFADEVVNHYGENLKEFNFPWMAFLTGNVSLKKDLLNNVGTFDERFLGYGYEDWELGYRLHKAGAIFCTSKDIPSYHQEHPISFRKWHEATKNYLFFTEIHPDIDVLVLGLEIARITDLITMSAVLGEYKTLELKYPDRFFSFKRDFFALLKTVALLLKLDMKHKKLVNATGIEISEETENDLSEIKNLGGYENLIATFEKIMTS
uniref:Glycosyltransferase 2-like domain-containing protein n=1 Tax=Batrachochytrium dendrobatidis (strain JAM81 / FGSC 10211) TaxID=684364 RepID=F4PFL9_BATDJ|eukprot:XP_006683399.1 hypothetical protein BATDEDRAFT_93163 [Batrachochytrium dendrobatidis JAM81]